MTAGRFEPILAAAFSVLVVGAAAAQPVSAPWYDAPTAPDAAIERTETRSTLAPLSFVRFCMRRPAECEARNGGRDPDESDLADLRRVNASVNAAIRPRRKQPVNGVGDWALAPAAGDCNDYAVTKRHELLRRGWSSGDLLLSVVETSWGEGHLVLSVRVGDDFVVLDNLTQSIVSWRETDYRWLKRQSSAHPQRWVSLETRPVRRHYDVALWDGDLRRVLRSGG